jgi:hypothetical protein
MNDSTRDKSSTDGEIILPWYHQFWFWFVFGPLIFIIFMCGVTISIALRGADDVVIDNYYKEGRMINQTMDQDKRAAELGLVALVKFELEKNQLVVRFDHPRMDGKPLPDKLLLNLSHPVKAALDQLIVLNKTQGNHYEGILKSRPEYSWYMTLYSIEKFEDRNQAEWTLSGQINFSARHEAWLKPRPH